MLCMQLSSSPTFPFHAKIQLPSVVHELMPKLSDHQTNVIHGLPTMHHLKHKL